MLEFTREEMMRGGDIMAEHIISRIEQIIGELESYHAELMKGDRNSLPISWVFDSMMDTFQDEVPMPEGAFNYGGYVAFASALFGGNVPPDAKDEDDGARYQDVFAVAQTIVATGKTSPINCLSWAFAVAVHRSNQAKVIPATAETEGGEPCPS